MPIAFDTHTHTLMSGHAYSTLEENLAACSRKGMEGLVVTDHGPTIQDCPNAFYFMNMKTLPRKYGELWLLRGAEANIIDYNGGLDLPDQVLKRLDVCIASYHESCIAPLTSREHTAGWLKVIRNPYVDIIGHSGRGPFPMEIDEVVALCREQDKLVEINNLTLSEKNYQSQCYKIASACKAQQVKIVVNSDAHFSLSIGEVKKAMKMLAEINFPEELIVNRSFDQFAAWLKQRKPWLTGF